MPRTLGCDLLFTTRRYFQLPGVSSQSLNVLSSDAAYDLLKSYRVPQTPEAERYARAICNAVGYLPLAIILAGAYLRDYQENISFSDYSQYIRGQACKYAFIFEPASLKPVNAYTQA